MAFIVLQFFILTFCETEKDCSYRGYCNLALFSYFNGSGRVDSLKASVYTDYSQISKRNFSLTQTNSSVNLCLESKRNNISPSKCFLNF